MEFEHVHLQLEAAVSGLGIALASLPLIEKDIESGRLVCPIRQPEWCAQDYVLISEPCNRATPRQIIADAAFLEPLKIGFKVLTHPLKDLLGSDR
jgi:LysR family transcriptional regulator, glycine cleavage system transcriptional activator